MNGSTDKQHDYFAKSLRNSMFPEKQSKKGDRQELDNIISDIRTELEKTFSEFFDSDDENE